MKKLLLGILVFMTIFLFNEKAEVKPAKCAFCYSGQCLNSSICGQGCVCLKRGIEPMGLCYSVD